ncbi:MAG: CYTH domain-containing protein [Candidatus Woesearchaeota archaeon]|jgi:predicted adenylyl cyclase CyaB
MAYEIEKRSLIASKSDFNKLKTHLQSNFKYLGTKHMKTFLFRTPSYLRIRLIKNEPEIVITHKSGDYYDPAREEIELELNKNQLSSFISLINHLGFKQCSCIRSERRSYRYNGLKIELNQIEHLGMIVEIEAITTKKKEISKLNRKVKNTMDSLNLKELKPAQYQRMLDKMYLKTLRSTSKQVFKV